MTAPHLHPNTYPHPCDWVLQEDHCGKEGVWGSLGYWDEKQAAKAGNWFRPVAGSHDQDSSWKNATNAAQLGPLIRNTGPEVAAGTDPKGRASSEVIIGHKLWSPLPTHSAAVWR